MIIFVMSIPKKTIHLNTVYGTERKVSTVRFATEQETGV